MVKIKGGEGGELGEDSIWYGGQFVVAEGKSFEVDVVFKDAIRKGDEFI